jgi:hypothetical protein
MVKRLEESIGSIVRPSLYMMVVSLFSTSVQGSEGKVNNIYLNNNFIRKHILISEF